MKTSALVVLSILALVSGGSADPAAHGAEGPVATPTAPPSAVPTGGFDVLRGRWVRPDGGYVITIKGVDGTGRLDAGYANPSPLPFAKAEASRDGTTIKVFLELRAGGYDGSTYTLTYDPVNDILAGVYFQAVVQRRFDVYFTRAR